MDLLDTKTNEKKSEVTFVDVEVWGKQAEPCQKYLTKGSPVMIEGRLKLDQWEDKASGQKRSKLKIVAENVQFLSAAAPGGNQQAAGERRPATKAAPREDLGMPDENIPF